MTDGPILSGPTLDPAGGGPAKALVVFLHGWGADGNDLISLGRELGHFLPDTAFAAPHAPDVCEANAAGRQWFSILDRTPAQRAADADAVRPVVDRYLDAALAAHGLGDAQLALVGFSQGTMLALHAGLRREAPAAAIVGYSGMLVGAERLEAEIAVRPPVLLVHGDQDPIVPVQALSQAVAVLSAAGVPIEHEVRPGLGHGIDGRGLELGLGFLARHLSAAGALVRQPQARQSRGA